MAVTKPMRACDIDPSKIKTWPMIIMPKIDGVRLLKMPNRTIPTSRELKPYANVHTTNKFTGVADFDGELTVTGLERSQDCCRKTTSAVTTIEGAPDLTWWLFDYITDQAPYEQRLIYLDQLCAAKQLPQGCRVVEWFWVHSFEAYEKAYAYFLRLGYEGAILRDPKGRYKSGKCTANEANYLREKPVDDEEAIVTGVTEGEENLNEATLDNLGHTTRSTHQENKVPNGMIGSIQCWSEKWGSFNIGAGALTHLERKLMFEDQSLIVGKSVTFTYLTTGIKDKPRQARYKSIRAETA